MLIKKGEIIRGVNCYKPSKKDPNNNSEELAEQINLVNWVKFNYSDVFLFATINERKMPKSQWVKLKKQGLVTGVPDLFFSWGGKSLFIEMKKHNGDTSDFRETQRYTATLLNESGQYVCVCYGFEAAKVALIEFFNLESVK